MGSKETPFTILVCLSRVATRSEGKEGGVKKWCLIERMVVVDGGWCEVYKHTRC